MTKDTALSAASLAFDERPVPRRIGLIALATDLTSETDFVRYCPPDEAAFHVSRIAFANPVTPASLGAMEADLEQAAALIMKAREHWFEAEQQA